MSDEKKEPEPKEEEEEPKDNKEPEEKPEEKEPEDSETPPDRIEEARQVVKDLEKANKESKKQNDRKEKLQADAMLAGNIRAGGTNQTKPHKLTDTEYAEALQRGEVNPLKEDGFIK